MAITFQMLPSNGTFPSHARNIAFLRPDNWDDFGHKTLFSLTVFDEQGNEHQIGSVKIGFIGQHGGWTEERIPPQFNTLQSDFFSLGQDADYYKNLVNELYQETAINILLALGDVVHDNNRFDIAENEGAFTISLMRDVNRSTVEQQFKRILRGDAPLTSYNFFYEKAANDRFSGIRVNFQVEPNTKPSSNIHILIGRNGVGKTTLLNNMVDALLPNRGTFEETGYFATESTWSGPTHLNENYFAGVVSVSFSAFDSFEHPIDQPNANLGMRYHYVGLKKRVTLQGSGEVKWILKDRAELCQEFTISIAHCFAFTAKKARWTNAVQKLESDFNFAEMDLCQLLNHYSNDFSNDKTQFSQIASAIFDKMSSGHAVVLLTITKLVESVEEQTLVLLDEPESHLHPPLLSAFTRALSDLLENRNGVAIIATHSPVVLQEVPRPCVSVLRRTRLTLNVDRPQIETFAENVGVLTREVFGLEVSKSGFHELLTSSVNEGGSFEEIEHEYQNQLGFEGRAILRAMISIRNSQTGSRR